MSKSLKLFSNSNLQGRDGYFSFGHALNLFLATFTARCKRRGGILIEFAFSIPVLVILLLFVCDHYRFYELRNKIKSSTYLLASMIQQLGNTRSIKQLTKQNLNRMTYTSCLNFFHTISMFYPWPFGIYYVAHFHYVKRESSNSYKYYSWECSTANPAQTVDEGMWNSDMSCTNESASKIQELHPDLLCSNDGDERLLITCLYGSTVNTHFSKSKLGFFMLEPSWSNKKGGNDYYGNFVYQLVITPKPGLFPPLWQ